MAPKRRTRARIEESESREDGEIRDNPTGMERMMQMFTQTLQHTQERFATMLQEQRGQGREPHNPRANQGDPWVEQMSRLGLQRFEGSSDPTVCKRWLKKIKSTFSTLNVPPADWVRLAVYHLDGEAEEWWEKAAELEFDGKPLMTISWSEFTTSFNKEYFPTEVSIVLQRQFWDLKQGNRTVEEYATEFRRLECFVPAFDSEEARADRFVMGLREGLRSRLILGDCSDLKTVTLRAIRVQQDFDAVQDRRGKSKPPTQAVPVNYRPPYSSGSSSSGKRRKLQSGQFQSGSSGTGSAGSSRGSVNIRTCYTCGQPGHIATQCAYRNQGMVPVQNQGPAMMQNQSSALMQNQGSMMMRNPRPTTVTCYNCGKAGHVQKQCPEPPKRAGNVPRNPGKGRIFSILSPDVGPSADDVIEGKP